MYDFDVVVHRLIIRSVRVSDSLFKYIFLNVIYSEKRAIFIVIVYTTFKFTS